MPETKMSAEEMTRYYVRVHHQALARDRHEPLSAVTALDANRWVNRFTDFAHRLGMKKAFRVLESRWGSLTDRSVLDIGCGRGRWSKEYDTRGAKVTGVDVSPDAINLLASEMPQHLFISQDITALNFPDESFDVVNSVTVLQHMPEWKQRIALGLVWRWVKRGGYVVLLENILAFKAPHVFPHHTDEWVRMVEATGLKCNYCWGSNFEVLFRVEGHILHILRRNKSSEGTVVPSMSPTEASSPGLHIKCAVNSTLAVVSLPVEWACHKLPLVKPTHSVMIFSK